MGGKSRAWSSGALLVALLAITGPSACGGKSASHAGKGQAAGQSSAPRVGDPCVPDEEQSASYDGTSSTELLLTYSAADCVSLLCVVNHHQGRVSCPYGQTSDDLAQGAPRCFVPGSSTPVTVPVRPALVDRQASETATCSCRCAGPGSGPFCACPTGTECVELLVELDLPDDSHTGSYCIPPNTKYDPASRPGANCDEGAMNCGEPRPE